MTKKRKVLLPIASAADLGLVPSDLIGCFNLIFYQSAEDAVFNANHTEHMLLLKYANKKDRIGSRTGSLSCLFLLSRGDVVNGTKLLKQRIKALVDVLLCIP